VALAKAIAEGAAKGAEVGEAARIAAAIDAVIKGIETKFGVSTNGVLGLKSLFTANNYNNATKIAGAIIEEYKPSSCLTGGSGADNSICPWAMENFFAARKIPGFIQREAVSMNDVIEKTVKTIVSDAPKTAETAAKKATEEAIKASTDAVES
uniref:RIFIN RBK21 n=1 Tax=Plasmodium falciparum TaxID=5833 RepID=UPI003BEF4C79